MFRTIKRATIAKDTNLLPYAVLLKGERGTVVTEDHYGVDILMDKQHDGLCEYDNVAHIAGADRDFVNVSRRRLGLTKRGTLAATVAAVTACVVTVSALGPEIARAYRGPAIDYADRYLVRQTYRDGEKLEVQNTAKRLRACVWSWEHSWTNVDTHTVMANDQTGGTSIALTPHYVTYKVRFAIPRGLAPGNYSFNAQYRARCDHDDVLTGVMPPLHFHMEG